MVTVRALEQPWVPDAQVWRVGRLDTDTARRLLEDGSEDEPRIQTRATASRLDSSPHSIILGCGVRGEAQPLASAIRPRDVCVPAIVLMSAWTIWTNWQRYSHGLETGPLRLRGPSLRNGPVAAVGFVVDSTDFERGCLSQADEATGGCKEWSDSDHDCIRDEEYILQKGLHERS